MRSVVAAALAVVLTTACAAGSEGGDGPRTEAVGTEAASGSAVADPGSAGVDPDSAGADRAVAPPRPAEVAFVTGMVPHHAQALRVTSLVEGRAHDPAIAPLAWRMDGAQRAELRTMRRWLEERGEPTPSLLATHDHDPAADGAAGMLTEAQLVELDEADGPAFDRLFLERMIEHHRGALAMVDELYASGEVDDLELAQFAHEVEADQRFEIHRMEQLLERLAG